ncbi:hypothetical protein BGX38DRAFT_1141702 [Terfezia claveryi]|nr:hypothetical protein BGX38DRAFT_1141702 [Terfezia claveryi]
MNDEPQTKKRKPKWAASYSNISIAQAQKRLGFRLRSLKEIPVETMLESVERENLEETKNEVHREITRFLRVAGAPTEDDPDIKESSINHLVYAVISPIIERFINTTGRENVQLQFEKEIISTDGETGGEEEIVAIDLIEVDIEKFIFVVGAKRSSLGQAMKQCLLSMKDMHDNNGGGEIYGFVTTGRGWRMLKYDGGSFQKSEEMIILFDGMGLNPQRWMDGYSVIVDCVYAALKKGGGVEKNVAVK